MRMLFKPYEDFGKVWHLGPLELPEAGRTVYAVIDVDTTLPTTPELIEATCRWVEGHNPPFLWDIHFDDGTTDKGVTLAGGSSVYFWRYK